MLNPLDPMVTCPYEESHRGPKSRLAFHLLKCTRQHKKSTKQRCVFDVTHLIEPVEYENHIANCPSRGNWDSFVHVDSDKTYDTGLVNEVTVESPSLCDEDWSGGNTVYDPLTVARERNVFIPSMCLSKKQRKNYKISERNRIAKLEKQEAAKVPAVPAHLKPLRAPKTVPKALLDANTVKNESKDQNASIDNLISQFGNISAKDADVSSSKTQISPKNKKSKENIPKGKN